MQYVKARAFHRFMAYFIDNIIIMLTMTLITSLIPYFARQANLFNIYYDELMNALENNPNSLAIEYYSKAFQAVMQYALYYFLISFALWFIYYVVIAHFWSKQTVGRMLFMLVVVKNGTCEKLSFGRRSWREIVGYFLYNVLSASFILPIANIVFSFTRNNTLCDMISGTNLVYVDSIKTEVKDDAHGDAIDAQFEESKDNKGEYKVF